MDVGHEIAGTRITVFDVLDYVQLGWDDKGIAIVLSLGTDQVRAARNYIETHDAEVQAESARNQGAKMPAGMLQMFGPSWLRRTPSCRLACQKLAVASRLGNGDAEHPG